MVADSSMCVFGMVLNLWINLFLSYVIK